MLRLDSGEEEADFLVDLEVPEVDRPDGMGLTCRESLDTSIYAGV